jgi:glycosyltransferase involved in cell wall biosynthesis
VRVVHVVVPEGVDDPHRPSGGNTYDRRVCDGLGSAAWQVHEHAVAGAWPHPGDASLAKLGAVVAAVPDGSVLLVDGLVASAAPEVLVPAAQRLRVVVLLHMPLQDDAERAVLRAAAVVVATSHWTRRLLAADIGPDRVEVAEPGVDLDEPARGTPSGGELLCVAAVTPAKGYDVLLDALDGIVDLPWRCVCVGSLERDPGFAEQVSRRVLGGELAGRVQLAGPRAGAGLASSYAAADVLVHPSRAETYGMVVADALARGLPVVASEVGGLPGTLGRVADGCRPGLLVPPGDAGELEVALRRWLEDAELRNRLRERAALRRTTLHGWDETSARVERALEGAAR